MKRVLYIGYLKEQSDWGFFATQNILALEKAGYDVVCRSIDFSTEGRVEKSIQHLYNKDIGSEPYDVTFQHVFPSHMLKSDDFGKCVGIVPNDRPNKYSTWWDGLDLMDDYCNVRDVLCIDPIIYKNNYSGVSVPEMDANFKFYTTANAKSLPAILRCFHTEFDADEPVNLIIQKEGKSSIDFHALITEVKSKIGLMPLELYKKDMVVDGYDSPVSRYQLHAYCNCFISEGQTEVGRNDMESMYMGNVCIGVGKYLGLIRHFSVDHVKVRKRSQEHALFPDRNNAREFENVLDEEQLAKKMREAFEIWKENPIQFSQLREGVEDAVLRNKLGMDKFKEIIGE